MTEEKQGAAEWLRGIADKYEAEEYSGCIPMVELFGLRCTDFGKCEKCRAKMMRAIADRIDAERALPEGIEWPRFEDGELVRRGDEVECDGDVMDVVGIFFEDGKLRIHAENSGEFGFLRGYYGERVKRPTRKVLDADGAPINVGDAVYFVGGNGSALIVERIDANGGEPAVDLVYSGERIHWHSANPEKLTHERPDSWERLEEDAAKRVCEYAGAQKSIVDANRFSCVDCPYDEPGPHTDAGCNERMRLDIVRRAKALAKKEES